MRRVSRSRSLSFRQLLIELLRIDRLTAQSWARDASEVAERGMMIIFVMTRLVIMASIILATPSILGNTRSAPMTIILGGSALAYSALMIIAAIKQRELRAAPWGYADVAVCCVALVGSAVLFPQFADGGPAAGWAGPYAVNAAAASGVWTRRYVRSLVAPCLVGGVYLFSCLVLSSGRKDYPAIAGFVLVCTAFGIAAAAFAYFWRHLARTSDEYRDILVREEKKRADLNIHPIIGLLRALADPETRAGQLPGLRSEAAFATGQLREFLKVPPGLPARDAGSARQLEQVLREASAGLTGIRVVRNIGLARSVDLSPELATAMQDALRVLLMNVTLHANATKLVMHASADDQSWEVTVHDNGQGFESVPASFGYGLGTQVIDELGRHGVNVIVWSRPGEGCLITMTRSHEEGGNSI